MADLDIGDHATHCPLRNASSSGVKTMGRGDMRVMSKRSMSSSMVVSRGLSSAPHQ